MKYDEVYKDGEDNGWLKKQNYWFDPEHPHGFEIASLDTLYPEQYFQEDHVKPETIVAYCEAVRDYFLEITQKPLKKVIEFGTGGGWFAEKFREMDIMVSGIEGTHAGFAKAGSRGGYVQLGLRDLRIGLGYPFLGDSFDIALCTEVAEHVETPFSAILVESLTKVANLVWFSSEEPNTNPAHRHHPNEMPVKFWINLFEFYGYGCYMLPDHIYNACEGRGRMIFYNKAIYEGNQFLQS